MAKSGVNLRSSAVGSSFGQHKKLNAESPCLVVTLDDVS